MKHPLLSALPLFLGLSLPFSACQTRENPVQPGTETSSDAGKVAFRLPQGVVAAVAGAADSVRLEAARDGYAPHTASGAATDSLTLSDLAVGAWTIKVAVYDRSQVIHWYGEVQVQVLGGRSVDAEVHLKPATGSVKVRIVLDSLPAPVEDTSYVQASDPSIGSEPGYLPIDNAWRTDSGVFVLTHFSCEVPTFRLIPDSGTVFKFGSNLDIAIDCFYGATMRPVVVFTPWKNCGNITLLDAKGGTSWILAAKSCYPHVEPVDTVAVGLDSIFPAKYSPLPIDSTWRSEKGIYFATRYDYFQPVVVHELWRNSHPNIFTLVGTPINTLRAIELRPHVVFVPFASWPEVVIEDMTDTQRVVLPGGTVPAADSSFVKYVLSVASGWTRSYQTITITPNGIAVKETQSVIGSDTMVQFDKVLLDPDPLAKIRQILEMSSTRHPGVLPPMEAKKDCPTDQPTHSRHVYYADGTVSTMSWNRSSYCLDLPSSWQALDAVDQILQAASWID